MKAAIRTHQADVETMKADVATMKADVAKITEEMQNLKGQLRTINALGDALKAAQRKRPCPVGFDPMEFTLLTGLTVEMIADDILENNRNIEKLERMIADIEKMIIHVNNRIDKLMNHIENKVC